MESQTAPFISRRHVARVKNITTLSYLRRNAMKPMKPMKPMKMTACFAAFTAASMLGSADAAPIDTWNIARDSDAGSVNSGLSTDSPTFGDGSENNIDKSTFTGEFGETVSLAVGETLTVTYGITLTGGSNDSTSYRFVVGDYGVTADLTWTGAWNFIVGQDLYQGRTNGNIQSTGGNAVALGATQASTGSFAGDSSSSYTLTWSITRDSATTVDLEASLVGGNGSLDQTYTKLDQTTSLFDYNGVGISFGGDSNMDQAVIANASFTVVPEPGSLALIGLGGLCLNKRRRRG